MQTTTKRPVIKNDEYYLSLLKSVLSGAAYTSDHEYRRVQFRKGSWQGKIFAPIGRLLALKSYALHKRMPVSAEDKENGLYWPEHGLTMIGRRRLDNVEKCLNTILKEGVEGDVIETGVWRGGTCIFMKAILQLQAEGRRLFVADSFEGVPKPNPELYPADAAEERAEAFYKFPQLAVSREEVEASFQRFGMLDENVVFLKGWFKDTLHKAPIDKLALMRLDGDLYESTMDALRPLYPKLQSGGFCIIDDYGGIPACAQAVENYRAQHGIREPIVKVDTSGVYWRKS